MACSQVGENMWVTRGPITWDWHLMLERSLRLSTQPVGSELTLAEVNWLAGHPAGVGESDFTGKDPQVRSELFCVISEFFLKQFPKCNLKSQQKQCWINAYYLLSSHSIKIIYSREYLKEPQCSLRKACSYELWWTEFLPQHLYAEALTLHMTVFGDKAFRR